MLNIEFQDGFPISTILAIFNLQVNPMLPIKFQVNCSLGSGEKAKKKKDFQDGCHFRFLIRMILAIFDLQVTLMLPIKSTGL